MCLNSNSAFLDLILNDGINDDDLIKGFLLCSDGDLSVNVGGVDRSCSIH